MKLFISVLFFLSLILGAAEKSQSSNSSLLAQAKDIEWFTKGKFGIFLHWGPSTIIKERLSWSRNGARPGHITEDKGVPKNIYDNLYKKFNPEKFDADRWANLFHKAGAKYIIFTTKHHDGFCMFDAPGTDYKITNSPFKRDIAKELSEACHKVGIKIMWYYSQPDWYHPDCLDEENHERYKKYMYSHLRHLNTQYGKVAGMWFDGLRTKWQDWDTPQMLKMVRDLQPGIIVNSRAGRGLKLKGKTCFYDFDNAELRFGKFQIHRPWEMCATMTETWGWSGGNNLKPFKTCMRMLIASAGAGGNLALNTAPMPNGEINSPEASVLLQMGSWLKENGESIYNTIGGPYKPGLWGCSTRKNNKIYLHITQSFSNCSADVNLPDPGAKILKVTTLKNKAVSFIQKNNRLKVRVPASELNDIDNIVVLHLDSDAENLKVIESALPVDIAHNKKGYSSSEVRGKYSAANVFGEPGVVIQEGARHKLSWIPSSKDETPWLAVDLGSEVEVDQIEIREQVRIVRTRKFTLQCKKGDEWVTFYKGVNPGLDFTVKFKAIKARHVRVVFNEVEYGSPSISYFKVYQKQ